MTIDSIELTKNEFSFFGGCSRWYNASYPKIMGMSVNLIIKIKRAK